MMVWAGISGDRIIGPFFFIGIIMLISTLSRCKMRFSHPCYPRMVASHFIFNKMELHLILVLTYVSG